MPYDPVVSGLERARALLNGHPAAEELAALYAPLLNGHPDDALVIGHVGQSLDGQIATRTGASRYITGGENLVHIHRLRALVDAVVVGASTVEFDDPQLTVRLVSGKSPVLIDSYLRDAIEVDVDAIADGKDVFICGVMEHIEEAGVHSGDSACSLPPHSLKPEIIADLERQTIELARALNVVGLMNVQFAIQNDDIYHRFDDVMDMILLALADRLPQD